MQNMNYGSWIYNKVKMLFVFSKIQKRKKGKEGILAWLVCYVL